jgi:predicted dehydrogenase
MKQVVQDIRSGESLLLEVPTPRADRGTALVRTAASLVSVGTERALLEFAGKSLLAKARSRPDLVRQTLDKARREGWLAAWQAVRNRLDQPLPLGYSAAGTVIEVGAGVQAFHPGDRVACAGGGYALHAEVLRVPQNLMSRVPDQVDFESAAFTTLAAIALHGFRLGEPQLGERVAVLGLGVLGQLAAGIARAAGCEAFGVDLDPRRVALANAQGLAAVQRVDAEDATSAHTGGLGFDLVLICADSPSNDTVELAGTIARDRGRVVAIGAVGMELPRRVYYAKELSFQVSRSYGPGRYDPAYEQAGRDYPLGYVRWTEGRNLGAVLAMIAAGKLDVRPLISHTFPIDRAPEAYDLIANRRDEPYLGVLLTYSHEASLDAQVPIMPAHDSTPTTAAVRIGAVGCGNFATAVLFPALRKLRDVELVGIASAGGLSAAHAARKFGFAYAAPHAEDLYADERINTIAVLTPHHLHAHHVGAALVAGKNVFCEKPLALSAEELEAISEAMRGNTGVLMLGFNRRFAPLAQQMKGFLDRVREPLLMHYRINAGALPRDHWVHDPERGGGRLLGEVCHFIDFLAFLAGSPPDRVVAQGLPDREPFLEDNLALMFSFPDGSVGTISYAANGDRAFSKERLEVFSGGKVAILNDYRSLELVQHGRRRTRRHWLKQDKGHAAAWAAFTKVLVEGGTPPIPYEHVFGVSMAAISALEALRANEVKPIEFSHLIP